VHPATPPIQHPGQNPSHPPLALALSLTERQKKQKTIINNTIFFFIFLSPRTFIDLGSTLKVY
jgi:hypothetical protein